MLSKQSEYRQENYEAWIAQLESQIQEIWLKQNEQKNKSHSLASLHNKLHSFCVSKMKQDSQTINGLLSQLSQQNNVQISEQQSQLKQLEDQLHHCVSVMNKLYESYGNELFHYNKFFKNHQQSIGELKTIHDDYCSEINQYKAVLTKSLSLYKSKHERRTLIRKMIRNTLSRLQQVKDKSITDMLTKYGNTIEKNEIKIDKKDIKLITLMHSIKKKQEGIALLEEEKNKLTLQYIAIQGKQDEEKQKVEILIEQCGKQQVTVDRMNYNLSLQCQELQKKFTPKLLKLYEYEQMAILQEHFRISEPQCVVINGSTALSSVCDESLLLWKFNEQESSWKVQNRLVEKQRILSLCFFDDGNQFFGGLDDGSVVLWKLTNDKWIIAQTEKQHQRGIKSIFVDSLNELMVSGSDDGMAKVWKCDNDKWEVQSILSGHRFGVFCVQFNRDSRMIATGSFDNSIILWSPEGEDWKQHQIIQAHNGYVTTICFSKTRDLLASGSNDNCLKLWEMESNGIYKKQVTLYDHKGPINSVVFNSDSSILISGSQDGCIKFWRQTLKEEWMIYQEFQINHMVYRISIGLDDQSIMVGTLDGTTHFYRSLDMWD